MRQQQQQQMALSRQRLLTLVYGDMETVRMVRTFSSKPFLCHRMANAMHSKAPKLVCGTVPSTVSLFLSFNLYLSLFLGT
jgi:hypothetical protein